MKTIKTIEDCKSLTSDDAEIFVLSLSDDIAEAISSHIQIHKITTDGNNTELTDKGIMALCKLHNLETLDLEWATNITDKSLERLALLQKLTYIDLMFCDKISAHAIESFKRKLPNCTIEL